MYRFLMTFHLVAPVRFNRHAMASRAFYLSKYEATSSAAAVVSALEDARLRGTEPYLLGPDKHRGAGAIRMVEDQSRAAPFEVFEREVDGIPVEVDAVVAQERKLVGRGEPQQPER